jgi:YVTN family beta-propeller protein
MKRGGLEMGLKQRFSIVLIGMMKAVEGFVILGLIFGATSVSTHAQGIVFSAEVIVGGNPCALAVNPNTNKIYVANNVGNNVTVIDGATNNTSTLPTENNPFAIVVNPNTNLIYVTNNVSGAGSMTLINGATNTVVESGVGNGDGTNSDAVAVNPVTNQIRFPS